MYDLTVQQGKVVVDKVLLVETGTHNDMTRRPYQTHMSGQTMDTIREVTQDGRSISASALGGVANHFIRPNAQAQGNISIQNGWETSRLRFLIQISYYNHQGELTNRKIIQGYTDQPGYSMSGAVDPNMNMYFNSIITLRHGQVPTPSGLMTRTHVAGADHLLRGQPDTNFYNGYQNAMRFMRPEDIFTTMNSFTLDSMDVQDLRTTFATEPVVKSRRKNNSAPHYVTNALTAYRNTMAFAEDAADISSMYNEARGLVKEDSMTSDKFFFQLKSQTANFASHGYVTYGELCSIFPEFDQVAVVMPIKKVERNNHNTPWVTHQRGDTEYWSSATNETVWASILTQSVPSVMMDLMLTRVAFMATNQTLDGSYHVQVLDAHSFVDNLDLSEYIQQFIQRLQVDILSGLSSNNGIDFRITMLVDVTGDTRVRLSIAGGDEVEFAAPSFCDALYTPVLTENQQDIANLTHDFQFLSENLDTDIGRPANPQTQPMNTESNYGSII